MSIGGQLASGLGSAAGAASNPLFQAGQAVGSGIGAIGKTAMAPVGGLLQGLGINPFQGALQLGHQAGASGATGAAGTSPQDRMAYVGAQMAQQGQGGSAPPPPGFVPPNPMYRPPMPGGVAGQGVVPGVIAPSAATPPPGMGGAGIGGLNLNDPQTMMRLRQMIQAGLLQ